MQDAFAVGVQTDVYKYFIDNALNCHWHNDFEYGVLQEGAVDFYINNTCIRLTEGDGYFLSANTLHMARQVSCGKNAVMRVLTFPASVICADVNGFIYVNYLAPLLNTRLEGFRLNKDDAPGRDIIHLIDEICRLERSSYGYELICQRDITQLWLYTLQYMAGNKQDIIDHADEQRDVERMKEILSYIHRHYNEKITAEDISRHLSISRGECFRCFKRFMGKTLVDYINEYRLQRVASLLRETGTSITDICIESGFGNSSYFGKLFKDVFFITPLQYRRAHVWTSNMSQNINGYDYQYYKESGNGIMTITTNAENGSFLCNWSNTENILFRSGKQLLRRDRTHSQIGGISLRFDGSFKASGNTYLCIYGWTVAPLVEWYIIEHYNNEQSPMRDEPHIGTHFVDGGEYDIYQFKRENWPSIVGTSSDFGQYWSIRTSARERGVVDVSSHFKAWENLGLPLGRLTEVSLSIESLQSSGSAHVRTNIISL